jgi:hypothetical protein
MAPFFERTSKVPSKLPALQTFSPDLWPWRDLKTGPEAEREPQRSTEWLFSGRFFLFMMQHNGAGRQGRGPRTLAPKLRYACIFSNPSTETPQEKDVSDRHDMVQSFGFTGDASRLYICLRIPYPYFLAKELDLCV